MPGEIFIVGMNGSGTTMLLDHLSSHSRIYGFPAETKCLPYFIASEGRYGDLAVDENYARLWHDMREAITGRYRALTVDPAPPSLASRSAAGIFGSILGELAAARGKDIWCEKTPMHVRHIEVLASRFPGAKFLHIIRDGLDCAASFHRRWGFHPRRTVVRWKRAVSDGMRQGRALGGRYTEVSYEGLTANPEATMRSLLDFLGVGFEASVLRASRSRPNETAPAHGQVVRNARDARQYFSARQIAGMERIAGRLLAELGYVTGNSRGDHDPGKLQMRWWELTDDARRLATVSLRRGRLFRPSKWAYLTGQIRNALKQKRTS